MPAVIAETGHFMLAPQFAFLLQPPVKCSAGHSPYYGFFQVEIK